MNKTSVIITINIVDANYRCMLQEQSQWWVIHNDIAISFWYNNGCISVEAATRQTYMLLSAGGRGVYRCESILLFNQTNYSGSTVHC